MKRLAFILLSIVALVSVSCNKEITPAPVTTSNDIVFTADIENGEVSDVPMQSVATRAAETTKSKATFVEGDKIGVFVVPFKDASTQGTLIASGNYADNVAFERSATGEFAPAAADRITFPSANTHISIYAFAMYSTQFNTLGANPTQQAFAVSTDQSTANGVEIVKNDIMTAQQLDVTPGVKPNLQFAHRMAMVQVDFTTLTEYRGATVTAAAVTIDNVVTDALINMTDNAVAPITSGMTKKSIKAYQFSSKVNVAGGLDCVFEAIVVPQTVAQGTVGVTVALTTATDTYNFKCELPQNVVYSSGNLTKISLAFDKEFNLTLTSASIKAWGDGGAVAPDARKPAVMNFKIGADPNNKTASIRYAQLGIDKGTYSNVEVVKVGDVLRCTYLLPENIIGDKLNALAFFDMAMQPITYTVSNPLINAAGLVIFGDPTQQNYSEIISTLTFN